MRKVIKDAVKVQVLVACTVTFSGAVVAVFVAMGNMVRSIIRTLSRNNAIEGKF